MPTFTIDLTQIGVGLIDAIRALREVISEWSPTRQGKAFAMLAAIAGLVSFVTSFLIRTELRSTGIKALPFMSGSADTSAVSAGKVKHVRNVVVLLWCLLMTFYVLMPSLIGALGSFALVRLFGAEVLAFPKVGFWSFFLFATSLALMAPSIFVLSARSECDNADRCTSHSLKALSS